MIKFKVKIHQHSFYFYLIFLLSEFKNCLRDPSLDSARSNCQRRNTTLCVCWGRLIINVKYYEVFPINLQILIIAQSESSFAVDPLNLKSHIQSKNISVVLSRSQIKIWGKSVQWFLRYDRTNKQRLQLHRYTILGTQLCQCY